MFIYTYNNISCRCKLREIFNRQNIYLSGEFELDPQRELFIWAILLNRRELAHFFWKIGQDHLGEFDIH